LQTVLHPLCMLFLCRSGALQSWSLSSKSHSSSWKGHRATERSRRRHLIRQAAARGA
jgi:hypothetical protein